MFRFTQSRIRGFNVCVTVAAALAGAASAGAGQIFTDRDAFLAAAMNGYQPRVETFETGPIGQVPATGVFLPAVQVLPLHANINSLRIDSGAEAFNVDGTKYLYGDVRAAEPRFEFELVFPDPVYSFGAQFYNARSGRSLTLRDEVGDVLADMTTDWFGIGTGFFGFTLDQSVTRVRFTPGSGANHLVETFGVDNVVYGVVPEPSALGLLLIGAACTLRRRVR